MKRSSAERQVSDETVSFESHEDAHGRSPSKVLGHWFKRAKESPLWRLESALVAGAVVVGIGSAALSEANREAANRTLIDRFKIARVVVAGQDLNAGASITSEVVQYADVLATQATVNTVDEQSLASIMGRTLAVDLKKGDSLLLTAIVGTGTANAVAAKVPPGKRLVTLQIRDKVVQKGWIRPNDRVDVIATMELPSRGRTTFTLLQDITIVSVGKASISNNGQSFEGSDIGFYVEPKEVEFIAFAESRGNFSLSLRNPNDIAKAEENRPLGTDGIDLNKFLDHATINRASGGGDLPVYVEGQKGKRQGEGGAP